MEENDSPELLEQGENKHESRPKGWGKKKTLLFKKLLLPFIFKINFVTSKTFLNNLNNYSNVIHNNLSQPPKYNIVDLTANSKSQWFLAPSELYKCRCRLVGWSVITL